MIVMMMMMMMMIRPIIILLFSVCVFELGQSLVLTNQNVEFWNSCWPIEIFIFQEIEKSLKENLFDIDKATVALSLYKPPPRK